MRKQSNPAPAGIARLLHSLTNSSEQRKHADAVLKEERTTLFVNMQEHKLHEFLHDHIDEAKEQELMTCIHNQGPIFERT